MRQRGWNNKSDTEVTFFHEIKHTSLFYENIPSKKHHEIMRGTPNGHYNPIFDNIPFAIFPINLFRMQQRDNKNRDRPFPQPGLTGD